MSTMEKSPCLLGNEFASEAVTDRISKLTWLLVYVLCHGQYRLLTRAGARAPVRRLFFAHNGKVATLAWELKWSLSGCRLDFGVNMGPVTRWSIGSASDARARVAARGEFCIARNRLVAMSAWKLKWSLSGGRVVFRVNVGLVTYGQLAQRPARARARPRVVRFVLPAIGKSPCWPGRLK